MDPGLKLLIELILEFAPVITNIVQKNLEARPLTLQYQYHQETEDFIQAENSISHLREFERKKQQQQLADVSHQTQLKIVAYQRETALKLPESQKIIDNWPLRLSPSQILDTTNNIRKPLKIFLAPPKVKFDKFEYEEEEISEIETMLAEGLREFLNKHYSLHNPVRPTEFLAGAWDSKRFHSESSIKALFGILKTEPILILESEADGNYLNFRIGYWGMGQENYYYQTISRLPYKEIVEESAKNRALEWRKIRNELIEMGESIEEINNFGEDNAFNLATLEKAEKWEKKGIDISKLSLKYKVNRQDIETLCQVLITGHTLAASWIADIFHLIHHDVAPLLPELLPSMIEDATDIQSVQKIAIGYQQVYQALQVERRSWIPEMALQLAQSLSHLSDRTLAEEQVDYSVRTWLQLRQISQQQLSHPLQAMRSAVGVEDKEYVEKLREYYLAVGDCQSISYVEEILNAIASFKHQCQQECASLRHTLTGHSGKISSIAICSDAQNLVSGCVDKTIKVWNVNTGKAIRTLSQSLAEVSSVAVSPDGNLLAVGSCDSPRSNVKVWHISTGKLLHTLLGHQKPVNCVAISSDGQILASGSNKIKIWNLHNGDRICTLWHSSVVNAAVISPDGTILISGSSDNKIRLWNPHTGEPLRTLNGHSGEVKSVAVSPDGQILVSGSSDKTIKIWHIDTSKVVHTLTGHSDEVKSVVISPNGQILFSASADKTIKIWHLYTGELLQTLTGHLEAVNCIAISPDNQFIASGSSDRTIKIWQIA
ncbi:MAG: WD40 repeat domain-containing protein [Rhizonema sp. NSF051]|nr:WD40 repeat domain-containing protein [Rhizonema sp. NSF051]